MLSSACPVRQHHVLASSFLATFHVTVEFQLNWVTSDTQQLLISHLLRTAYLMVTFCVLPSLGAGSELCLHLQAIHSGGMSGEGAAAVSAL